MSTRTRSITRALIGAALSLGLALAAAPAAQAGPAYTLTSTCETLTVGLSGYPATANNVIVTIDDVALPAAPFGESYSAEIDLGDPTLPHTYAITIHAEGGSYDPSYYGESVACEATVLRDATAALSTIPAGCSNHPETLVLGAVANARWGTPSLTVGPGAYTVTAIADPGHEFADGTAEMLFSGVLAAEQVTPACTTPQVAGVAVIPPTPPTTTVARVQAAELAHAGPEALPIAVAALVLLLGGGLLIGKGRNAAEQV